MGLFDRFRKKKTELENSNTDSKAVDSKKDSSPNNQRHNFGYLDNLIHSGSKEIFIDSDIVLDSSEAQIYSEGIKIDVDNLIIDGNGHTIDAKSKSRIFFIEAKNILIKNITLSNGFSDLAAGAIWNEEGSSITMTSVKCIQNSADQAGGAIINLGEIIIEDSKFSSNHTKNIAGAINNQPGAILTVKNSEFIENTADVDAGAIGNYSELSLEDSRFDSNSSKHEGGAINSQRSGILKINKSKFQNNLAEVNGGAIITFGDTIISSSIFSSNNATSEGGAINNQSQSLNIKDTEFSENNAIKSGGAIISFGKITISTSKFESNKCSKLGGAINNQLDGVLNFDDICFIKNHAAHGGAIFNFGKMNLNNTKMHFNHAIHEGGSINNQGVLEINTTEFISNTIDNMGASIFNGNDIKITNSLFSKHDTGNDIVYNMKTLKIIDSKFIENKSKNIILNNEDSSLDVLGAKFIDNHSEKSAIYNTGKTCSLMEVTFENNSSDGEFCADIYNMKDLILKEPKFINDERTVYNEGHIDLK